MNAREDGMVWMPGWGVWLTLVALVAAGLVGSWPIAAALLALYLWQVVRPFDFLMSYLLVVAAASLIRYAAGQLTRELSMLSGLILFMLVSYAVSNHRRLFVLPKTSLLLPLLAYVGLSLSNYARGVYVGLSPKYATLELLPVLALASAILVANVVRPHRDLRLAAGGLLVLGYANACLGYYYFSVYHVRAGGTVVPGMTAMLAVSFALRSRGTASAVAWSVLAVPLVLHQFITYTRGIWLGYIGGLLALFLIYHLGRGSGTGHRWRRVGLVAGVLLGLGLTSALALSVALGRTDFLTGAGGRFASITALGSTHETASNLARIAEYAAVTPHIAAAPWLGHGLGYTYLYREPLEFGLVEQWYAHQMYLFVWLKQGLVGLLVLLWLLGAAAALGIRASRYNDDSWTSGWAAAAAACTVLLAVTDLTNFQLAGVNAAFPLALLWGGAMAIGREGFIWLRWGGGYTPPPRADT